MPHIQGQRRSPSKTVGAGVVATWCWSDFEDLPNIQGQRRSSRRMVAAAKLLQSCPTLCDPIREPTRLPCPWDSPSKNTGVGCHFLLQCMKVKSESEAAQSCPTLSDTMDCSLPGSSVHGIFQARVLEWGAIVFSVRNSSRCSRSTIASLP